MPRLNATSNVARGFVSTRTRRTVPTRNFGEALCAGDYDTPSRNPDVATTDAYTATLTFVLK